MNKKTNISIIIIIIVVILKFFFIDLAIVKGNSMLPTFENHNLLLYTKINKKYNRFDVVIITIDNKKYIKRIIGLPGENISYMDNILYIDYNKTYDPYNFKTTDDFDLSGVTGYSEIPDSCYFVLGDNRENSYDSRSYGVICEEAINGGVILKLF